LLKRANEEAARAVAESVGDDEDLFFAILLVKARRSEIFEVLSEKVIENVIQFNLIAVF